MMPIDKFDYNAPAELFPSRNRKVANKIKYRRFDKAAEAVCFAVEEQRFGHQEIRALYDSARYPLKNVSRRRRKAS